MSIAAAPTLPTHEKKCALRSFPSRPCWPRIGRVRSSLAGVFPLWATCVWEPAIMRILLTGASGQLGAYLLEDLIRAGHRVFAWSRRPLSGRSHVTVQSVDITDEDTLRPSLKLADPEVIIHAAAVSAQEEVRKDLARAMAVNVDGSRRLALWCRAHGRRLVFTSTDMVFDGTRSWYREDDEPRPVQAYGRTKALAEQ